MCFIEDRMHWINSGAGLAMALLVSTFVAACGGDADTLDRAALERESLERELELALQPDTTLQLTLTDIPVVVTEEPRATPAPAPTPAPRPTPPPSTPPRQATPQPTRPSPAPAPAPVEPRVVTYTVPAGTTFGVRLNESLSTNSHSVGSAFSSTLTEAIYGPNGRIMIPAGATVQGRVVESRESGRAGQDAHIAVEFTSISHAGQTYSISGSALDAPVRLVTRDSNAEKAAKIGGGAAVGAVLGQVIGRNTRSTIAGAAIGAAAGTAVAMGTAEVDAVIDSGSLVTIRLDRGVTVSGS